MPNLRCARLVRDGGIDAMAALHAALREATVGLNSQEQQQLRLLFGKLMGDLTLGLINPAIEAFPELKPDERAWISIARERAAARARAV